ncbi:MAG TPA: YicC family protein [Clostridiaceae bacterium]|nr:YicC family protein [Clostridiaceae bacterium]
MVKSMTGFGRALVEDDKRSFLVEIRGVNHRYLDLNIRMPKSLMPLEDRIRKVIAKKMQRGKMDVFVTYKNIAKEEVEVLANETLAKGYVEALRGLKKGFSLEGEVSISLLAKFPDVLYVEEKEERLEELWTLLVQAVEGASSQMLAMKTAEGAALKEDLLRKKEEILSLVEQVKEKDKFVIPLYKARLEKRITELLDKIPVDEQRLALEIAMYTDKASIDEEITRLTSHMEQLEKFLEEEEPVGRKLDFLAQEMNREANTMASKSVDLDITNLVLSIKNEVEKIREQMQNIE